jgi:hypothetical protein
MQPQYHLLTVMSILLYLARMVERFQGFPSAVPHPSQNDWEFPGISTCDQVVGMAQELVASLTTRAYGLLHATTAKHELPASQLQGASLQVSTFRCTEIPTHCKTVGSAYVGSNPTPATSSSDGP